MTLTEKVRENLAKTAIKIANNTLMSGDKKVTITALRNLYNFALAETTTPQAFNLYLHYQTARLSEDNRSFERFKDELITAIKNNTSKRNIDDKYKIEIIRELLRYVVMAAAYTLNSGNQITEF